ncbi:hypothetical protein EDD17DRAFT_1551328 [Pisolithus thermaeus]|nr:hypothetical protein EDD17DRAFT_1551328 [Pisolithus thermaeus]
MADSIPGPWIRDYLIEVAERHGEQLYNVPLCNKMRKVQLTELLTFHENSYVWAWISDKTHRIAVRISKEGVEAYEARHSRKVIDCRFSVVFIQDFRPIFAPRPVGANQKGNTPMSHIALEVGCVKFVGIGSHVFCDPKDVESNASVKEWVMGLREDGGGGNILKLRKQEQKVPAKTEVPPSRRSSPASYKPPGVQAGEEALPKPVLGDVNPKPLRSRPIDLRREHSKRWRAYEVDRWKFACKPTQQEAATNGEAEPIVVTTDPAQVLVSPTPHISRTPLPESPKALVPQGTPSAWSPSQRASPVPQVESWTSPARAATTDTYAAEFRSELEIEKPTEETIERSRSLRSYSPPPPTPAQRRGRVSPIFQSPSSPLLPSSAFPLPSFPTNLRKKVKRKVPPPEVLPMRDPNHSGPTQILVPNSDPTASTTSQPLSQVSQSHTMSQTHSQSQSHVPPFPSSLSNEFKPGETSTPRTVGEISHTDLSEQALGINSELNSSQFETGNEQALGYANESNTSRKVKAFVIEGNQVHEPNGQLPPGSSLVSSLFSPTKSEQRPETEEEPCERKVDVRPPIDESPAAGEEEQHNSVYGGGELSEDDMETHAILCRDLFSTSSTVETTASNGGGSVSAGSPEPHSMHSLFSASPIPGSRGRSPTPESTDTSSDLLPAPDIVGEEETSTARMQRKHRLSEQSMPPPKRTKMDASFDLEVSAPLGPAVVKVGSRSPRQSEKTMEDTNPSEGREQRCVKKSTSGDKSIGPPSQGPTVPPLVSQREGSTKLPRLDGLTVDLMSMFHDSALSHFRTTWGELQGILLRTGRVRTLGEEVLRDGSVFLNKD